MNPKVIILKLNSDSCNLCCDYCYENKKNFSTKNNEKIIAINFIEKLLNNFSQNQNVKFILHGGEPLLSPFEYLEELFTYFRFLTQNRNVTVGIQTNGTIISPKLINLFRSNSEILRSIGISIDGPIELHDSVRKNKSGEGSWMRINSFVNEIRKNTDLGINAICVISKMNINYPEKILDALINDMKIKNISLNPCFLLESNGIDSFSIRPLEYFGFLQRAFKYVCKKNLLSNIKINPFYNQFNSFLGNPPSVCLWAFPNKCNSFITVYPDGSIYPCDEWSRNDKTMFFNLKDNLPPEDQLSLYDFNQDNYVNDKYKMMINLCSECKFVRDCGGGCFSIRSYWYENDIQMYNEYCDYRIKYIKYLKPLFVDATKN